MNNLGGDSNKINPLVSFLANYLRLANIMYPSGML